MNSPYSIIGMDSADFNNDGNMDFIGSSLSYGAYIYLGNGDGTFQSQIQLNIGTSWGVCAGDFNNDGNDDFIFDGRFYPGNGDGTFGSSVYLGFYAYAIAESDINNDGNLDIVYTDSVRVIYRTGNGDGTFTHVSTTYVAGSLFGIATSPETEVLEVIEGETVGFTGRFTDEGYLDTHTATWDWGDGSPIENGVVTEENEYPLSSGEVTASHAFEYYGEYTITLTVTDDDGASDSETIRITVITPEQATQNLIGEVEGMWLSDGIENSFVSKLEGAIPSIENDRPSAYGQLGAFINEVEAQRGGALSDSQADELIEYAQWIMDNI
jgi:hypothetical protein